MAQKKNGSVKGTIYDSINDYALQSASVTVYKEKDSSVVDFQLSNTEGAFEIKGLPLQTRFFLAVTHTGYQPLIKNFEFDSLVNVLDFKKLGLSQKGMGEMDEVVIKAVQPLRMNGDTLEINPDAFKLDSNAVVEDMLLRVPGLTVWGDGTITMNGRKLEKVYVDGKPFFGGAAQTATQNLPKNAIEKIQLYQEKDLSKLSNSDQKNDSLYSMNIKLKGDKKNGMFGKVGAGYGTDKRYQGDGVLQAYDKKNQYGIAVGINNINKEEGTGENAFEENTFKSNFRFFYMGRGGANTGITRRTYGNLKWQHNFSESDNSQFYNRMTTDYGYLNTLQNSITDATSVANLTTIKQTSIQNSTSRNYNESHTGKFLYENRKKWGNFVSLNGNFVNSNSSNESSGVTSVYNNDVTLASRNAYNNYRNNNSNDLILMGFVRSNDAELKNDPRKNFMLHYSGSYNQSKSNTGTISKFESFVDSIYSNTIDRRYNNDNKNYNLTVSLNYDGFRPLLFGIYNFFNIDMSLRNEFSISRSESHSIVEDLDTAGTVHQYKPNLDLTNDNKLVNLSYKPGLSFTKGFSKYVFGKYNYWTYMGLDLRYQFLNQSNESSLLYRNIKRDYGSFTPGFNASFSYNKENAYRMGAYMWMGTNISTPSIDQLAPIVDNSTRYSVTVGNPGLTAGVSRYANFNFDWNRNKIGAKSSYGLRIGGNYNGTDNGIGDSIIYISVTNTANRQYVGQSYRYLINVNKQRNLSGNWSVNFSRNINKMNTIGATYTGNMGNNSRPGYIKGLGDTDARFSISENRNWSNGLTLQYNLVDKFNISIGEMISINRNIQSNTMVGETIIKNYATNGNVNYFVTKKISLNTSVNHQINTAGNKNTMNATIWNASALYRFMQQKAEVKFSAFDLLRQNRNINNFLSQNMATTTITNGLQQYFMVSFSYYPRKFGSGGKPPPPPGGIMIVR